MNKKEKKFNLVKQFDITDIFYKSSDVPDSLRKMAIEKIVDRNEADKAYDLFQKNFITESEYDYITNILLLKNMDIT